MLRWTTHLAWGRHHWSVDQQPHGAGALPADLHRLDSIVSGSGVSKTLPRTTGMRTGDMLRKPEHHWTSMHRLLDRQRSTSRSASGAVDRPLTLLIGVSTMRIHAPIAALPITAVPSRSASSPNT